TVGPSSRSADRAPLKLIAPTASTSAAPSTATTQSGAQRARATAAIRIAASATSDTASFIAAPDRRAPQDDECEISVVLRMLHSERPRRLVNHTQRQQEWDMGQNGKVVVNLATGL